MNFGANLKEIVGLIYGVFMGTSTIYVKAERTHAFPETKKRIGNFDFAIGGMRNRVIGLESAAPNAYKTEKIGSKFEVVFLVEEKVLVLGDLFYNRVHPPLKELQLPTVGVLREILQELTEKYKPENFLPAEGDLSQSYEEFLNYLSDLGDNSQEFETLRVKYSHFKEIVGLSSFSENFDYLRR